MPQLLFMTFRNTEHNVQQLPLNTSLKKFVFFTGNLLNWKEKNVTNDYATKCNNRCCSKRMCTYYLMIFLCSIEYFKLKKKIMIQNQK